MAECLLQWADWSRLLFFLPQHRGVCRIWTEVRSLSFLTVTMRGKQLIFLLRQVRKEVLRAETFEGVSPGLGSPLAGGRRGCLTACAARSSFGSAPALPLNALKKQWRGLKGRPERNNQCSPSEKSSVQSFAFCFKGIKYSHTLCVINFQSSALGW